MGAFMGQLKHHTAISLGSVAMREAVLRSGIRPDQRAVVDEVILGNVFSANLGQNPTKQSAVQAGLPVTASYALVNKVCASGMKAVMQAAGSLLLGFSSVAVAGGTESMSSCPFYDVTGRRGQKLGARTLVDGILQDGLLCGAAPGTHMGDYAERVARELRIGRDAQDDYALESYRRAAAAQAGGHFLREIAAMPRITKTEAEVPEMSDEPLGRLDIIRLRHLVPCFKPPDDETEGTITAANASSLADGAAALVLARESTARKMGLKVRARILGMADAGMDAHQFPIAPRVAIDKLLKGCRIRTQHVHAWEINEAFAAVALANIQLLDLDPDRVNVHGGAIALGHPLGASGARILVSLMSVLEGKGGEIGIASVCNGGGDASAIAIQMVG